MAAIQSTEAAPSSLPVVEQERSQLHGPKPLPLELELMIVSYIPLGLSGIDAEGWRDLEGYLRVCHAWTDVLRKRIARDVPLDQLVVRIRDVEIINGAVRQWISHAQSLPEKEVPHLLDEAARYVVLGAFPEALRLLLDAGVSPNYKPHFGPRYSTLLHRVILSKIARGNDGVPRKGEGIPRRVDGDRLECVRLLISRGFDIEAEGHIYGYHVRPHTPLAVAVIEGLPNIAVELLHHGANVHVFTEYRVWSVPLVYGCAIRGHWSLLSELLAHGGHGAVEALLQTAISRSDLRVFDYFLQSGFPIEESEQWPETPLERAVYAGNSEMVMRLVEMGADVRNRELLAICINRAWVDMIQTLVGLKTPITPSVWSALVDKPEKADVLLTCDPLLDPQPLMDLWIRGHGTSAPDLLRVCLKHGADPNQLVEGIPLLSFCVRQRYSKECVVLLEGGAEPNPKVPLNAMPIYIALERGFHSKVQLLHRFGATFTACPGAEILHKANAPMNTNGHRQHLHGTPKSDLLHSRNAETALRRPLQSSDSELVASSAVEPAVMQDDQPSYEESASPRQETRSIESVAK